MWKSSDMIPLVSAFAVSVLAVYTWIKLMQAREVGQFIREEGPEAHLKKAGIPTMGGVGFLFSSLLLSAIFIELTASIKYIFVSVLLFALIGFYDDYKKLTKRTNEGLSAKGKFLLILLISVVIYLGFLKSFQVRVPFTQHTLESVILSSVFMAFLYAAVTNATNFTDGLDGLLAVVTIPIIVLFIAVSSIKGMAELKLFNLIFLGSMLGYLVFNMYPAKVFMGDLGSLAIGAYVVSNSIILNIYWLIPLFGLWYVIEVLSVIIQVLYFKKTGGKRFFKMAPYHHHLEYLGWNERKIDLAAFLFTAVCSGLSFVIVNAF